MYSHKFAVAAFVLATAVPGNAIAQSLPSQQPTQLQATPASASVEVLDIPYSLKREAYRIEPAPPGMTPEQVAASWKAWRDTRSKAMKWEMAFLALSAVDAAQTISCVNRDVCEEINPLYGKSPSTGRVLLLKGGLGVAHFLLFQELNRRNPKTALRAAQFSAAVQGAVVLLNVRTAF